MARPANPNLLYLVKKEGGLELPSLSGLYKQLQASRQCQLLTSADPCVCRIAEDDLQAQVGSLRVTFCPAVMVRDVMQEDPSRSRRALAAGVVVRDVMQEDPSRPRRALAAAVKQGVTQSEQEARMKEVFEPPRQGQLFRSLTPESAEIWATTLRSLLEGAWKFVQNTLPHINLHLWHKKQLERCAIYTTMSAKT